MADLFSSESFAVIICSQSKDIIMDPTLSRSNNDPHDPHASHGIDENDIKTPQVGPRPRKMTKEEKAESQERARLAIDTNRQNTSLYEEVYYEVRQDIGHQTCHDT
jgi:hypothetical protein